MKAVLALTLSFAAAAAAFQPGEVLVLSPVRATTDAAAGLWYAGSCPAGNFYLAEERALASVSPYRVLHDDPETTTYFLAYDRRGEDVWRAGAAGRVEVLGNGVYFLALPVERVAALPAGLRIELKKLAPMAAPVPVRRTARAEDPPQFDAAVDAALKSITSAQVQDYLEELQGFHTRYSYTQGYEDAAAWIFEEWEDLGYDVSYDPFFAIGLDGIAIPGNGDKAWVSSDGGAVYYSADGGDSWQTQTPPAAGFLWSIDFVNDNRGWAAGVGATVVTTNNGGATWTKQTIPYSGYVFGVDFVNADAGYVVGDEGLILRTLNGGVDWTALSSPTGSRLYDVSMTDATHGWACGREGTIIHTDDGVNWSTQVTGTMQRFYGIEAVSPTEAWACGWGRTVMHTTDAGATWENVTVPPNYGVNFYGIDFVDADHGFIAGGGGVFIATADGGQDWTLQNVGGSNFMACEFADASHGLLAGSGSLYRTADGGETFEDLTGTFADDWVNVVAEKKGLTRPEEIVIICGHMDSTSEQPLVSAPGADDNGSGSAATLAAAATLADFRFERTLRFVVWCGEEQGLLGSWHYASAAASKGENIVGVVNLDMVAYDEEEGARDDTSNFTNLPSTWLGQYFNDCAALYNVNHTFDLLMDPSAGGSDHASFWDAGYDAILLIEGETGEGGVLEYPYYHTTQDTVDKLDMGIQRDVTRAATATVAHLAWPRFRPGAVIAPTPAGREEFRVYPNPARVHDGVEAKVAFDGLTGPCRVEVYDLSGRAVFAADVPAGETTLTWNVGAVGSGVYVYRVAGGPEERTGKVAVIR